MLPPGEARWQGCWQHPLQLIQLGERWLPSHLASLQPLFRD